MTTERLPEWKVLAKRGERGAAVRSYQHMMRSTYRLNVPFEDAVEHVDCYLTVRCKFKRTKK